MKIQKFRLIDTRANNHLVLFPNLPHWIILNDTGYQELCLINERNYYKEDIEKDNFLKEVRTVLNCCPKSLSIYRIKKEQRISQPEILLFLWESERILWQ